MVTSTRRLYRATALVLAAGSTFALVALTLPTPARPCSCVAPRQKREVLPRDGARAVPTDARVRVFLTGGYRPAMRRHLAREYRLKDAQGKLVKLKSRVVGTRLDLIPGKRLKPNHTYTLWRLVPYDHRGVRMTDTQRWSIALRAGRIRLAPKVKVRLAWFAVSSFTTGRTKGPRKVPGPRLRSARLYFRYGGGDCGPGVSLNAKYTWKKPGPHDVVELEVRGQGVVASFLPGRMQRGAYEVWEGDSLCTPDKVILHYRGRLALRLAVRAISGRRSRWTPWTPAPGRFGRGYTLRSWSKNRAKALRWGAKYAKHYAAAVKRWATASIVKHPKPLHSGPAGCLHGFTASRHGQVAKNNSSWTYGDISTLAWTGMRGYLVLGRDSKRFAHLVRFDARLKKPTYTVLPWKGSEHDTHVDAKGLYVVTTFFRSRRATGNNSFLQVARVSPKGQARWSTKLATKLAGTHWHPRIVAGGGRVLVAWTHSAPGYLRTGLVWRLLDAKNGRVLAKSKPMGKPKGEGYPGLAYRKGHFFIAHHSRQGFRSGPAHLWVITKAGQELRYVKLPLKHTKAGVDLVPAGKGIALTTSRGGQIIWALINGSGRLLQGPVKISRGLGPDNRKPRIARRGKLYAVAWETHPTGSTHVTAVGPTGRVAPVFTMLQDRQSSTVGVAAASTGFVVSATRRMLSTDAWLLTCRKHAPSGAPARIRRTW